jgi:hypothetical protein
LKEQICHALLRVCFRDSFWVETQQIFTKSQILQILLLTATKNNSHKFVSVVFALQCCKTTKFSYLWSCHFKKMASGSDSSNNGSEMSDLEEEELESDDE